MESKAELLAITPNSERLIEMAGRQCYKSEHRVTDTSYINFNKSIIARDHCSVLEHATATIKLSNVSLVTTHQLVRHRLFSFAQKSMRYCTIDKLEYIVPKDIDSHPALHNIFIKHMDDCQATYAHLLAMGIKAESARYVLPVATATEITITGNFRQWRHAFEERLAPAAQQEIREAMQKCLDILFNEAPSIFADLQFPDSAT